MKGKKGKKGKEGKNGKKGRNWMPVIVPSPAAHDRPGSNYGHLVPMPKTVRVPIMVNTVMVPRTGCHKKGR